MIRTKWTIFLLNLLSIALLLTACKKNNDGTPDPVDPVATLSYGDSIIYLKPQSGDYIVTPLNTLPGTYSGFPEGIEIDETTGAINVSKSETGLRYLVTLTQPDGSVLTTAVVLSGITFADKYYRLSQMDSIAQPIYNANELRVLPLNGSVFDDGGGAKASGCEVQTINGQINLAQTIRNGIFGANPKNDDRKDIDINYRLNDGSNKAVNKLRVRIYYYDTMADVAPDLLETLQDRIDQGVFFRGAASTEVAAKGANKVAKPRPPCVIIIAN